MRRGVLELCVLAIIEREEVYPSDIIDRLGDTSLLVRQGTLYPLLSRLKNEGLLAYTWKESPSGPPRKYFHITEEGSSFLSHLKNSWQELVTAVEKSTQNNLTA